MRNLSNKNNAYTIYKAYTLNTMMRMLAVVKGETSKSYKKDYFPALNTPFSVVGATIKHLHIECYCARTDETTARTIHLDECDGVLPIEVLCENVGKKVKNKTTRINHTDVLRGDYVELTPNKWRSENHIGVFQGCVQIDKDIYVSYFFPCTQQKQMQGEGVLRCEIVSALTSEDKSRLYIVPVNSFVTTRKRVQTSSDNCKYVVYK